MAWRCALFGFGLGADGVRCELCLRCLSFCRFIMLTTNIFFFHEYAREHHGGHGEKGQELRMAPPFLRRCHCHVADDRYAMRSPLVTA
jgi:hypothetical protein